MSGPRAAVEQLRRLGEESHRAGLHAKAARFFYEARELAAQNGFEKNRVHLLFWEAYNLVKTGDADAAMPLLLEAANARMPEINPADAFNATIWLLEISLARKPLSFCRDLLAQTRAYISGINKESWGCMLDFLEGGLEFHRGRFALARGLFLQAWETSPQTTTAYPGYTPATYLEKLFDTAFLTRDYAGMRRWVEAVETCPKEIEIDKVRAMGARMRMFRIERVEGGEFGIAEEIALANLDALELVEGSYARYILDFLRVLMLSRRWREMERRLAGFAIEDGFMLSMFRGDAHLCQAREALGMPLWDDECETASDSGAPGASMLDEGANRPDKGKAVALSSFLSTLLPDRGGTRESDSLTKLPADPEKARTHFERAARYFTEALEEARAEDERLETSYNTTLVEDRLARVKANQ